VYVAVFLVVAPFKLLPDYAVQQQPPAFCLTLASLSADFDYTYKVVQRYKTCRTVIMYYCLKIETTHHFIVKADYSSNHGKSSVIQYISEERK
jgi:hypothetical protein